MIDKKVPYRVLLPRRIFDEAKDRDHFKQLLSIYMRTSYPNYIVKRIEKPYVLCERRE